jgi:hypothetical protein
LKLTEADIDFNIFVFESDDGYFGVDSGGKVPDDIVLLVQFLGESIEKMGLALYKIRANTNKIYITAVGAQI